MNRSKIRDPEQFIERLVALRFDRVFNPYAEECPECDTADAATTRLHNLKLVLEAALENGVQSIWVARDLGYRGGRRTGLALTDEIHLSCHASLLGTPPLTRATRGPAVAERTAAIVWRMLQAIQRPVFLWNVFPLHPHRKGEPLSNRCHTRTERAECLPLLAWLLDTLRPRDIIAIGRDAHLALDELGVNAVRVRHPSYGGQTDFISRLSAAYSLTTAQISGTARTTSIP